MDEVIFSRISSRFVFAIKVKNKKSERAARMRRLLVADGQNRVALWKREI